MRKIVILIYLFLSIYLIVGIQIEGRVQAECPLESITDQTGIYCCPEDCGECGGFGCHKFEGGEANCCTSKITNICDGDNLPCFLSEFTSNEYEEDDSSNDSLCPAGSFNDITEGFCCPDICESCGGFGCEEDPAGDLNCCTSLMFDPCAYYDPPCYLSTPDSTDENSKYAQNRYSCPCGSILDDTGTYCCPSICGQCGGDGCEEAYGGVDQCCTTEITTSCDESDPPCFLVDSDPNEDEGSEEGHDSICPSGSVVDDSNRYCCPESCGQCGGDECRDFPGGQYQCCKDYIDANCLDEELPCLIPEESYSYTCPNGGLLTSLSYGCACESRVCCPAECEVCDTCSPCRGPPECCARSILYRASSSDVDDSCRVRGPPCVVPPENDPCVNNPCQNGARCGTQRALYYEEPYTSESYLYGCNLNVDCEYYSIICECNEVGSLYSGEFCEIICDEGETPCGEVLESYGGVMQRYNDVCCSTDQECITFYSSRFAKKVCAYKERPSTCSDENACLNGGICTDYPYFPVCECPEGFIGGLCQTPVD